MNKNKSEELPEHPEAYLDLSSDNPSQEEVDNIFGGINWSTPETNFNGLSI